MILTYQQIIEAHRAGDIVIDPFEESQVQAASYDLRVGDQGATTSSKKIVSIRENAYLLLQPGDFGIVTALETLKLGPQYVGRFGLRSQVRPERVDRDNRAADRPWLPWQVNCGGHKSHAKGNLVALQG